MTINPSPNQTALIEAAIQAGLIGSAQEALDLGLRQLLDRIPTPSNPIPGGHLDDLEGSEVPPESWAETGGLWVHQGVPEPGADLSRVVQDIREERIASVLGLNS